MTVSKYEIRRGAYYDSVVLMQLQRGLLGLSGVIDAGVVMATQANCDLLATNHLLPDAISASPDDLLIVVRAESNESASEAVTQIDALLAQRRSSLAQDFRPRSLSAAARQLPDANWVLVSVPGRYAAGVARQAIALNKHVFLYSDNVSLEEEISLKKTARENGLLVMGPDCGTAIINGIGLGFANRVRRGPIGLVGASGTGLQAVTAHIHNLGGGISHAIGTGGRDLQAGVGAITASQALDLLARDPETKAIVLISKPPAPDVVTKLLSLAQAAPKPVVVYLIGYPPSARNVGNIYLAINLSEAAELAIKIADQKEDTAQKPQASSLYVRGLFSGGTLAYETLLGLQAFLSPIYSNSPISDSQSLPDPLHSKAHTIIDLGDEFFMVGRLHPMIDNELRIRRMRQEANDPEVGMILLDLVLGEGSHPDPAGELVPVIEEIRRNRPSLEFAVIVIGTEPDPQNLESQITRLQGAGAVVFRSATDAVDYVALRFRHLTKYEFPPVSLDALTQPLAAINVGLESFYESLTSQAASAIQVDWRPPAGGNEKLTALLAKMKNRE
jgi:FdrA protein